MIIQNTRTKQRGGERNAHKIKYKKNKTKTTAKNDNQNVITSTKQRQKNPKKTGHRNNNDNKRKNTKLRPYVFLSFIMNAVHHAVKNVVLPLPMFVLVKL